MVDRQEVEDLLAYVEMKLESDKVELPPPVSDATLAALCRAWLAVDEAPIRMVGDGISYGVSVAGTGMVNGQRVRIVKEPNESSD